MTPSPAILGDGGGRRGDSAIVAADFFAMAPAEPHYDHTALLDAASATTMAVTMVPDAAWHHRPPL